MLTIDTKEVYCIQDYINTLFKWDFTKGIIYKVSIFNANDKNNTYIRIYGNLNTTLTFGTDSLMNINTISEYFLTIQEQRKLKLKKLNLV